MIEILRQICGIPVDGGGPSLLGYFLAVVGTVVVVSVCIYTVVFLVRPGERNSEHIKRRVLRDDF